MRSLIMTSFLATCLAAAAALIGYTKRSSTVAAADPTAANQEMVAQLKRRGIKNLKVLAAMREVPRHQFVPEAIRDVAYADRAAPIGHEQTISQPYIVALMTELLNPSSDERILEIGTGSGYHAAVLSKLAAEVYTIEIVPELAQRATEDVARLGFLNVKVKEGDGFLGWPEEAPFDGILITCAIDRVPQPLIEQLKEGGRIVLPLGKQLSYQDLTVVTKLKDGSLEHRSVTGVVFVPMTGPHGFERTTGLAR